MLRNVAVLQSVVEELVEEVMVDTEEKRVVEVMKVDVVCKRGQRGLRRFPQRDLGGRWTRH